MIISKPQKEIYNYILDIFPKLDILLNDTHTIKPLELDIHIPSLHIAIEYDGEYWHYSGWAIKNGAFQKMIYKEKICIKNNIKLLRIREKEWLQDKEFQMQKIIDAIIYRNDI